MAQSAKKFYLAKYVVPISSGVVENGVVEVVERRIVQVTPYSAKAHRSAELIDLGNVALLPGLVNAHTHLELSDFEQPLPVTGNFTDWVKQIAPARAKRTAAQFEQAISNGLNEARQCGVAAIGDIGQVEQLTNAELKESHEPFRGVRFYELLGLHPDRYLANLEIVRAFLKQPNMGLGTFKFGLSPHATYTAHPDLLGSVIQLARQLHLPLAMHVAESADEVALIRERTGPLKSFFQDLGIWDPGLFPPQRDFSRWILALAQAPRSIVVHGNYLAESEWQLLAENRQKQSVVYCPRTHRAFCHAKYQLRQMLSAGVNVALGTDSRASNPDLHLWREMQTAAESHADVSPTEILKMGTTNGAHALGMQADFGELSPGKFADFCVVDISETTIGASSDSDLLLGILACKLPTLLQG